jgi:hypothetical protein
MADPDNVQQISVFNPEHGKPFNLYVRPDRLLAFRDFVARDRRPAPPPAMPGLSWAAVMGLDAIFAQRPKKFPVEDILLWLANDCAPPVSVHEVECALERFSLLHPPDVSQDA